MNVKKHIITSILLLVLTATSFVFLLNFLNNAESQFPEIAQVNYNMSSGEAPASVEVINKLSQRLSSKSMSFTSEAEVTKVKDVDVLPVYTTHSMLDLYDWNLSGESFTEDDVTKGVKKAIISDTLALKLYFNTDVIGKEFIINGEDYIVSGVYENSTKLINKLSKDGKERIYIPYTCADSPETLPIHTIVYDTKSSSAPIIEQMNLPQYHFTDLSEKSKVIETFEHIAFFIMFMGLCVVMIYLWFKLCKRFLTDIRDNLKEHYFFKSLLSVPLKYALLTVVGVGIPALLLLIFLKSDFSIYIVAKYIPYDNLFDIEHYINCIVDNAHYMNNLSLIGDTYLPNLYENSFSVVAWLTLLFFVLFVLLVANVFYIEKKLIKSCALKHYNGKF